MLHILLIAVLGYSAWQYVSPSSNNTQGDSIEAIMVDSSIMTEQYQRQLQHQVASQQVKQQQQEQIEKQAQLLQQKQLAEQQQLKELEKQRLLAAEKQKQQVEKAKAELAEQQKQALIAKQKADEDARLRAQKELQDKQRIDAERQKAEQEKQQAVAEAEKAKLEADKQRKILEQERLKVEKEKQQQLKAAEQAKQKALEEQQRQQALDDILGGLTSSVPKSQQGVSTGELDQFRSQIVNAISNKFINPNKLYSGKNCVLKIKIAPDGLLLSVTPVGGDATLCREAISATNLATFPKPKNNQLYQQVKEMTIDFKPR